MAFVTLGRVAAKRGETRARYYIATLTSVTKCSECIANSSRSNVSKYGNPESVMLHCPLRQTVPGPAL